VTANGDFVDFVVTRALTPVSTTQFQIPLDTKTDNCWAYGTYAGAPSTPSDTVSITYHGHANRSDNFQITVNSDGKVTSSGDTGTVQSTKPFLIHGWLMWTSWSLLAFL
jgi:hypothetical protein